MQILITGKQIDLGDSLTAYIEKNLQEVVEKYMVIAEKAEVKVAKNNSEFKTEVAVFAKGLVVRSTGQATDAYASFEMASSKLGKQLVRYKNKIVSYHHEAKKIPLSVIESNEEKEEIADSPLIVAEMETELPTCTVADAVMHMDLAKLPALLFKNAASGVLNMVYRRPDGNIGWVNPKD